MSSDIYISVIYCLLSANILLDEHLKAKIADFNLAKEATGINDTGKYTHITKKQMTEVMYGSKAYLPSDFFTNEATFSTSTDVFSFGMVSMLVLSKCLLCEPTFCKQ